MIPHEALAAFAVKMAVRIEQRDQQYPQSAVGRNTGLAFPVLSRAEVDTPTAPAARQGSRAA